jgi:AmiR/NasT family two-component response regulator
MMKTRVLLSGFEPANRIRVATLLKQSGHQAIVSDPTSNYPIDVEALIIDGSLNPERAFRSLETMRRAGVSVPVVMLLDSSDWHGMREARRVGAGIATTPVSATSLQIALLSAASTVRTEPAPRAAVHA